MVTAAADALLQLRDSSSGWTRGNPEQNYNSRDDITSYVALDCIFTYNYIYINIHIYTYIYTPKTDASHFA